VANARVLYDKKVYLSEGKFEIRVIAYEVSKNKKFPEGVKLRCVLLNINLKIARLLLDNHEPYGYHLHTSMAHDKNHRVSVNVNNYEEAIEFFISEAQEVIKNEI